MKNDLVVNFKDPDYIKHFMQTVLPPNEEIPPFFNGTTFNGAMNIAKFLEEKNKGDGTLLLEELNKMKAN
ncbi:MAG: hypothetical protein FWG70_04585 [Oscillospiraceae bacterium]|nr:hypothetical protein [Oscillospiraceae bacterium]